MKKAVLIFISFLCLFSTIHARQTFTRQTYKYDVVIGTIFQNDAPYLREWIEYHKLLGVQHFYLYNNNSTDNYREVLNEYVKKGVVDLIDWPSKDNSWYNFSFFVQPKAFEDAIRRSKGVSQWIALIDTDEFILPVKENKIIKCLDLHFKNCVGVYISWQVFGTSGVSSLKKNELMIEKLVKKAPKMHYRNKFAKTIVRPEFAIGCDNPHFVLYKQGYRHVHGNGYGGGPANIFVDKIRINHYCCRDENFLYNIKIPRYQRFNRTPYEYVRKSYEEMAQDCNQVYDDLILRFVPALRKNMGL